MMSTSHTSTIDEGSRPPSYPDVSRENTYHIADRIVPDYRARICSLSKGFQVNVDTFPRGGHGHAHRNDLTDFPRSTTRGPPEATHREVTRDIPPRPQSSKPFPQAVPDPVPHSIERVHFSGACFEAHVLESLPYKPSVPSKRDKLSARHAGTTGSTTTAALVTGQPVPMVTSTEERDEQTDKSVQVENAFKPGEVEDKEIGGNGRHEP
ncbi:hypothetical protein SVAN01_08144 [Stagonosporopsis vannaccii]|nr:hypothetical protein SVAN01_08144 [Stagonosporopsis vannaccii]